MKIFKPESLEDFESMAKIYNKAHGPFWDIYSDEEKVSFADNMNETAESLQKTSLSKEIICIKDDLNRIYGYAVFRKKNDDVVWISSLYVDPKFQRLGVGGELLKTIECFASDNKCKLVVLETHRDAVWAINFYKKNGYEIVNNKLTEYPFSSILDKPPVPNRPILAKTI